MTLFRKKPPVTPEAPKAEEPKLSPEVKSFPASLRPLDPRKVAEIEGRARGMAFRLAGPTTFNSADMLRVLICDIPDLIGALEAAWWELGRFADKDDEDHPGEEGTP